jgi:very-short-patch-repair endonuclease
MSRIRSELEKSRAELLDLGLRNTLLNFRKLKTRGVEVVDELPGEVFRLLVRQERTMSFLAAPEELVEGEQRRVPGDLLIQWLEAHQIPVGGDGDDGPAERHRDTKLQTPYTGARLERLLLNTHYTARTAIEEQGVNTLYLALGMLRWFESAASEEERSAPLLLVPVSLDRTSARSRFRLRYTGEELGANLSLQAKLRAEFRIELPALPPAEDLEPERYFEEVAEAVREQDRWHVDGQAIHLGFFWFTKLLMYEDLDPARWPGEEALDQHPVMGDLLGDGFADHPSPFPDGVLLDEKIDPADLHPIRDADSSQTLAILDVQAGRNLVVQGPPGTGKSQTISNLIAESVARGRRVLFVAEKMAALDVVKRRLDEDGVGDACLELHSHRTNKRSLLEELQRTLRLGKPTLRGIEDLESLTAYRDRLNAYAAAVNAPIGESGVTPYRAYGEALAAGDRMGSERPPPVEERTGWADWTGADFRERTRILRELETLLATTGVLAEHPFWSSCRTTPLLPRDRDRLLQLLDELDRELRPGCESCEALAGLLGLQPPTSLPEARRLIAAAGRRSQMPRIDGMAIGDPAWREEEPLGELIENGLRYRRLRREFDPKLVPEAWERDVLALRTALMQFGHRWWRFLAPRYRRAIRDLRTLSRMPLPKALEERLPLVDTIRESQRLERTFEEQRGLGERLFGDHWRGGRSDWAHLKAACEWLRRVHAELAAGVLSPDFLACASSSPDAARLHAEAERADGHLNRLEERLRDLEGLLELRRAVEWLRAGGGIASAFEDLRERVARWREDPDSLHDVVRYNHLDAKLWEVGLGELSELATRWPAAGRHLADLFTYEWHGALVERTLDEREELARFEGRSHAEAIRAFRDLDRRSIETNRARVALAHWEQLPAANGGGQLALLRHEMEKKRRLLPIRRLMEKAGEAIQRLKPVFMMSPLSIATYIPPGSVRFDLVVFDEASQIRPVDAFGAILRGQQAVVVGDSKQLPPTPFFEKLLAEAEAEEEERAVTGDLESVLGLFVSKGAPERMLRWHYRSRHDSLIAVSNHEFYGDGLLIFPSPDHAKEELGVVLHHHPETVYEPGSKRYNLREAEIVAAAVMEHARRRPDLSLGVAAFSQSQAQVLQDQVELRRRESPELEGFFIDRIDEPFFVKNLENVQGDERDIILISVGYGRQQSGALRMNFGPLNQDGGERRLNVLITRARSRCEVFSNFRADEIDLSKTTARGLVALKRYLQFAEDGRLDLPQPSERPPDSVFEELVAEKVRGLGYEVHPQVGTGGFFIDLAVVDPRRPGRYLLGIECDGRSYHSARWARDRDRLRQQILEGLGWSLHRVWSTDWFRNPDRELRKIAESLERARASGAGAGEGSGREARESVPPDEADGEPFRRKTLNPRRYLTADPYRCADLSRLRRALKGHDLHICSAQWIAPWAVAVVEVESPVHESELVRRIVDAAGYQRAGSRLQEAVLGGTAYAAGRGEIERRGNFLWANGRDEITVRNRGALPPAARSMDRIALEEIEAAVLRVVEAAVGIDTDEAVVEVARLFGFARTTEGMREPIVRAISRLVEYGAIESSGGHLRLAGT